MKKWILIVLLFTGCSADHQAQEAVVQTQEKVDFNKMHFGCDGNSITAGNQWSKTVVDISLRFSNSDWAEYPLFADKYISWIDALPQEEQVINIFMELSALGMAQPLSSNILEFLKALPECAKAKGITFSTPTEIVTKLKSVSQLDVAYPMSWVEDAGLMRSK